MKTSPKTGLSVIAMATKIALTSLAISPLILSSNQAVAAASSTQTKQVTINIAANALSDCIYQLADQAGIYISADIRLTQGKKCPAIKTTGSVQTVLSQLLQPFDLIAVAQSTGRYVVKKAQAANDNVQTLATAVVNDEMTANGSRDDGYRNLGVTNVGVWQGRTLQETPYSISVVSEDLLKNLQATSTDEVFKMNPLTQMNRPQAQQDQPYIVARGFRVTRSSRNGIAREIYDHGVSMEDVAQVEVLTGLSGFLYGPGHVGGMVNYVSKRPTQDRLNAVTVGYTGGSNVYIHGDFGGRLGHEDFGYRVNLVAQDGETATEHQELEKQLVSLAFDWQVTDDLLLQIDGSQRNYRRDGLQPYWYLAGDAVRPDAEKIDSDKLWGQKWLFQDTETQRLGANLQWQISDNMSLRAGYLDEEITRFGSSSFIDLYPDSYELWTWTHKNAPHVIGGKSGFIYFDVDFATADIDHKLNIGYRKSANRQARYRDDEWLPHIQEGLSLLAPTYYAEPTWEAHGLLGSFNQDKFGTESISLGDDITFNEQWSALIGINHSRIYSKEYSSDNPGDPITIIDEYTYDESANTPSVSVLYKPMDNLTTYASYMESLEQGGTANETYKGVAVVNANQRMKPLRSTQIELGAKLDASGILYTAALFEIDKGLEYYDLINEQQAKLFQDGRQLHRGFEFTATGQVTDNLTIIGGFTLLDVQIKELKQKPYLEGKAPHNVAEKIFKIYGEYNITQAPGLALTASASYTGDFYGDKENTDSIDGYMLLDAGARYQLDLADNSLTFRVNVANLTDERYWANDQYLGDGRRVMASATIAF